jgi:hypothetical protein
MSINYKDLRWKEIVCEDLTVGEVKEILIDRSSWKITHLVVDLTKEASELALGTRKSGIRNTLAISAISNVDKTINLKVKKGQLHIYLKAPKTK